MTSRYGLTRGEKIAAALFWTVIIAFFVAGAIGGILHIIDMFSWP